MPVTGLKDYVMPEVHEALLDAELRGVLDTVPAGVLLLGASGRIRFTNAKFAQLFGIELRSLDRLKIMIRSPQYSRAAFATSRHSPIAAGRTSPA